VPKSRDSSFLDKPVDGDLLLDFDLSFLDLLPSQVNSDSRHKANLFLWEVLDLSFS